MRIHPIHRPILLRRRQNTGIEGALTSVSGHRGIGGATVALTTLYHHAPPPPHLLHHILYPPPTHLLAFIQSHPIYSFSPIFSTFFSSSPSPPFPTSPPPTFPPPPTSSFPPSYPLFPPLSTTLPISHPPPSHFFSPPLLLPFFFLLSPLPELRWVATECGNSMEQAVAMHRTRDRRCTVKQKDTQRGTERWID